MTPFRDINVHASSTHYAFISPSTPNAQTLFIDRPSGDLRLGLQDRLGQRISSIAGILGIVKLRLDKYVIVITQAQPMGRLKGHMVYKVIATDFLPLRERALHDSDEDVYLGLLKNLLKGPMYFSYSLDLTNSFQRQAQSDFSLPLWKRTDDRFFWNRFIQSDLIDLATGGGSASGLRGGEQTGAHPYILPVIFGMLRIITTRIKATPITFTLITRRSRHRAGTRYLTRGIDEHGHVANYNETEQIVILNDGVHSYETQILSYVQTRGSVPVYWAEVNTLHYHPTLQVRSADLAVDAAKKHFTEQIRLYGDNFLVNLVNQRGREDRVKKAYEQMIRLISSAKEVSDEKMHVIEPTDQYEKLHYVYFDFHNETKGLKWQRAQLLLDSIKDGLVKGQYFRGVNMPADNERLEVRNQQQAVVRTNCMDCLDRTNVVQTMLARWTLTRQMIDVGVLQPGESLDDAFQHLFRNVWADNADVVSRSYSGTGALKTDFTRTGERTKAGMLQDFNNSLTRYVKNNFGDGPRQDAFDLFLGNYQPSLGSFVFVDRRPVLIQAIPYVLVGCIFFILISAFTRSESGIWPLRMVSILCMIIAGWCGNFIWTHGMLYVNWPKLNPPRWATEGYQDALSSVVKDKVVGRIVAKHERGLSGLLHLEEGKKRTQ